MILGEKVRYHVTYLFLKNIEMLFKIICKRKFIILSFDRIIFFNILSDEYIFISREVNFFLNFFCRNKNNSRFSYSKLSICYIPISCIGEPYSVTYYVMAYFISGRIIPIVICLTFIIQPI